MRQITRRDLLALGAGATAAPLLAACWLAVMKAGAVAVTVLATQRPKELATICGLARVGHALCDARVLDDLVAAGVPG
ncbi:hypothetical protein ADL35_47150, partial [Streptomyces sp. NRRL WC-3753]